MKYNLRKCACGYAKCSRWTMFGNLRCKEDGHQVHVGDKCTLAKFDCIPGDDEEYRKCSYKCEFYKESLFSDPICRKDYGYTKKGGNCRHGLIEKVPKPQFKPALSTTYQSTVCPKCGFPSGYDISKCVVRFRHQSSREAGPAYSFGGESYIDYSIYDLTLRSYYSPCPNCGFYRHVQDDVIEKEFIKKVTG